MVDVYCPHCGKTIPYSVIVRQVVKRKYSRKVLLDIIKKLGPTTTTGLVARQYKRETGKPISLRQLNNMIHELSRAEKIKTKKFSAGRYGATTRITYKHD